MPILEGVRLKPLFTASTLDKGLDLIRKKKIEVFHCIRNTAGALIDQETMVTLQFEKSSKLHQGFIIRNSHCGLCRLRPNETCCEHMAALAILSLIVPTEQAKAMPIPLSFAESPWFKIGLFLYEWLSRTKYTMQHSVGEGYCLWEIAPDEGIMQLTIPDCWLSQSEQLFPGMP